MKKLKLAGAFLIAFASSHPAASGGSVIKSGEGRTPLLELFSSEGCSSCPPADAFINSLKDRAELWSDFVPVVFHVDYWDYLGWKDPLASPEFTRRQKTYGRLITPGFILNGKPWWDRDTSLLRRGSQDAGALEIRPEGLLRYRITYQSEEKSAWRAHAVLLGFDVVSAVASGENAGETLCHDFVALGYGSVPLENGTAVIAVQPNLGVKPGSFGIAAWVSREGDPTPVQAAGGMLRLNLK